MTRIGRPRGHTKHYWIRLHMLERRVKGLSRPMCFASQKYLAKRMGVSTRTIGRYLRELASQGRLERTVVHHNKSGIGWRSRRLMKVVDPEYPDFGIANHTVMLWKGSSMNTQVARPVPPPKPKLPPPPPRAVKVEPPSPPLQGPPKPPPVTPESIAEEERRWAEIRRSMARAKASNYAAYEMPWIPAESADDFE